MTGKTKKMTMAELARLADVDVSTISRALNDSPLVRPETKALIFKLAEETGYAVNASARSLRRQSSDAIGIVLPLPPGGPQSISDPFFLEMVGAVSQAAAQRGYDLIVTMPQEEKRIAERRLLQTGRADGLIVIGQAGREERLNSLGPLAAKVVVWGGRTGDTNYTLVGSNNFEGGRLAGEHLLAVGRKRILFLGDVALPEVALRYKGLQAAHDEAGARFEPELVLKLDFGGKTAFEQLNAFIHRGARFDAIFAASDVLAIAAIHALRSKDMRVPEDVAIVGYDNIGQASIATPALTTIDQHIALGGEMMVDLLLRKLDGEEVESALTPTTLVVRASSGA